MCFSSPISFIHLLRYFRLARSSSLCVSFSLSLSLHICPVLMSDSSSSYNCTKSPKIRTLIFLSGSQNNHTSILVNLQNKNGQNVYHSLRNSPSQQQDYILGTFFNDARRREKVRRGIIAICHRNWPTQKKIKKLVRCNAGNQTRVGRGPSVCTCVCVHFRYNSPSRPSHAAYALFFSRII